jgi:hypothetical protein
MQQFGVTTGTVRLNEGRRQKAGGRICNGDLYPASRAFRLKRRGFRPDCFDNGQLEGFIRGEN